MNNQLRNQIRQTAQQRLNDLCAGDGLSVEDVEDLEEISRSPVVDPGFIFQDHVTAKIRLAALVQAYSTPGEPVVRVAEPRVVNATGDPSERTGRVVDVSDDDALRVRYDDGRECGGLSVGDVEVVE